jgi:phytoene synthase
MPPHSPDPRTDAIEYAAATREALDHANRRRLMRGGSRTFFAASLLLPASVRASATSLYAFCRLADDAVDLEADGAAALAGLQQRLALVYAGRPLAIEADEALASVVARHGIPEALPAALLEGFHWDTAGRRYETLEEVHDYAARVAGTVGAMMALIMGARGTHALARACELGVAMQLTNIARDVGEDARNGRLYLPRRWMREAGIDPDAWLAAPRFDAALGAVVARLLGAADELYGRAAHGIAELPRSCRPAIQAARRVYAEIGREVERAGLDSVSRRAVVPPRRKLGLAARSLAAAVVAPAAANASLEPLAAVRYLVDAGAAHQWKAQPRSFYERTVWVIEMFERVGQRDRLAHLMSPGADARADG